MAAGPHRTQPMISGPTNPPSVPRRLISPIDAAAAVPAKNVVGKLQSGGFAALTPNAVSESPAIATTADEPREPATAIPSAAIRHAIAACQ